MDSKPFISVIVAVYNAEKLIGRCLESLLAQDYPRDRYEIIVVDNRSNDKTAEIIRKYPVRYIKEDQTRGPAAARNKGALFAKGEALAFFDADQAAAKEYLSKLINGWEDQRVGAFRTECTFLSDNGDAIAVYMQQAHPLWRMTGYRDSRSKGYKNFSTIGGGICIIRRDVFKKLGGFDASMIPSEDFDFAIRMQKELNLNVKYNSDAVVYHASRSRIQLLKREYRIGFGDNYFANKYPELKKNHFFLFLHLLRRTVMGCMAMIFSFFRRTSWKLKEEKVQIILMDIGMQWCSYFGRIHYKLGLKADTISTDW